MIIKNYWIGCNTSEQICLMDSSNWLNNNKGDDWIKLCFQCFMKMFGQAVDTDIQVKKKIQQSIFVRLKNSVFYSLGFCNTSLHENKITFFHYFLIFSVFSLQIELYLMNCSYLKSDTQCFCENLCWCVFKSSTIKPCQAAG